MTPFTTESSTRRAFSSCRLYSSSFFFLFFYPFLTLVFIVCQISAQDYHNNTDDECISRSLLFNFFCYNGIKYHSSKTSK